MIGLIMLMGIVTKNSILLVDYAILARQAGMSRFDALVDACHKRSRPILMTTIAMGAGMMPLALGLGADPSFRSPMAITVIGGLITSTLLSLLVVPAVFTYIDDTEHLLGRLARKLRRHPPHGHDGAHDGSHGAAANNGKAVDAVGHPVIGVKGH
jgi:predicted RND superfamily exporter protein